MEQALVVENLKKSYGKFEALHGVSFEVAPGEIFALMTGHKWSSLVH